MPSAGIVAFMTDILFLPAQLGPRRALLVLTSHMRHADAGYDEAIACAKAHGLNLPILS
jgi:hypothetical protein